MDTGCSWTVVKGISETMGRDVADVVVENWPGLEGEVKLPLFSVEGVTEEMVGVK